MAKVKLSTPDYKTIYPGKGAYHFSSNSSPGFPWLNPDYVPFEIIEHVRDEIDRDENPDLEGDDLE